MTDSLSPFPQPTFRTLPMPWGRMAAMTSMPPMPAMKSRDVNAKASADSSAAPASSTMSASPVLPVKSQATDLPALLFLEGTYCTMHDWLPTLSALVASVSAAANATSSSRSSAAKTGAATADTPTTDARHGLRWAAIDWRSHGQSDDVAAGFTLNDLATDTLSAIDQLQLDRPILVGHSLGGMAALQAATREPAKVSALVLLEGWIIGRSADAAFEGDRTYGQLGSHDIAALQSRDAAGRARFPDAVFQPLTESCAAFDARPFVQTADLPIIQVLGAAGRTADTVAKLHIPNRANVDVRWVPGAGHYLPHERPADVAAACHVMMQRVAESR